MAAASTSSPAAAAFPDLDSIPPPPPPQANTSSSAASSSSPPRRSLKSVHDYLVDIFAAFPLYTFPPAPSIDPAPTPTPLNSVDLYIAPGHRRITKAADGLAAHVTTWTSEDVASLRWQMELLFRRAPFQSVQLQGGHKEAWGPKKGELPYLHLAGPSSSLHSGSTSASSSRLLATSSLRTWAETNAPYEDERVELNAEKATDLGPWPSQMVKDEARMWEVLLERNLMAAVLLAQYVSYSPPKRSNLPLFSHLLASSLAHTSRLRRLTHLSSLSSTSSASRSLSRWTGYVPSTILNWSWVGLAPSFGGDDDDEEEAGGPDAGGKRTDLVKPDEVDTEGIVQAGAEAIDAVKKRMASQPKRADGRQWFLGASRPTHLDSLLFAQLHTILSLSCSSPDLSNHGESIIRRLQQAIVQDDGNGNDEKASSGSRLEQWSRGVYNGYVKDKEHQWRRQQSQS